MQGEKHVLLLGLIVKHKFARSVRLPKARTSVDHAPTIYSFKTLILYFTEDKN